MCNTGVIKYRQAYPKSSEIINCQYLKKELIDYVNFLHTVRYTGKLQIDHVFWVGSSYLLWAGGS